MGPRGGMAKRRGGRASTQGEKANSEVVLRQPSIPDGTSWPLGSVSAKHGRRITSQERTDFNADTMKHTGAGTRGRNGRIYWRNQGGILCAYADLRDLGGGQ